MTRFVRRTVGDPISAEMREELKRLAAMPNAEINIADIPETTPEQFAAARKRSGASQNSRPEFLKAG